MTPLPMLPQGVPLVTMPPGATAQVLVEVGTPFVKVHFSGTIAD